MVCMVQNKETIGSPTNPSTNIYLTIFDLSEFSQNSILYIQTFDVKMSIELELGFDNTFIL